MTGRYFPLEEYHERWTRLDAEMRRRGYETAVIWSRSGGGYERCSDVLYLSNFYSQASGQGLDTPVFNARAFSAVIAQRGQTPELQADEPWPRKDLVSTDLIEWHHDPIKGVADSLNRRGVTGKVALVGTEILPMKYWEQLKSLTPEIVWEPADDLVLAIRRFKSPRELDCMREAGEIMTRALNRLIGDLISGKKEAEAAGAAAEIIVRAGGAVHMIPCSHGDMISYWCRNPLVGSSQDSPENGDLVRGWIYGPIREGYWLDPGRTAVAGGHPSKEQKALIERNANLIDTLIDAIRPGMKVMEVARLGEKLAQEAGGEKDQAAEKWPHFGHLLGMFFETPYIGTKMCGPNDVFQAGMACGVEAFLSQAGVGSSGFEQNFIIGETGNELLSKSPMIWW
jgi:Xaa-Pro dipeptidase